MLDCAGQQMLRSNAYQQQYQQTQQNVRSTGAAAAVLFAYRPAGLCTFWERAGKCIVVERAIWDVACEDPFVEKTSSSKVV
jgi:hypothetical protein